MTKVDAKVDITEAIAGLEALGVQVKGMMRKMLRALATVAKKRVKKRMGNYLHLNRLMQSSDFSIFKGKGSLRDAVYGFARTGEHAVVASGQMYKAEALEDGADLRPKKRKYLSFQGEDGWVRSKHLVIPPKRWFTRSIDGFEEDPDYQGTIDKVTGKAIHLAGLGNP